MAFIGAIVDVEGYRITSRLHGPLRALVLNPANIRDFTLNHVNWNKQPKESYVYHVNQLAASLAQNFCNGKEVIWAEVELLETTNGFLYSTVAEKDEHV